MNKAGCLVLMALLAIAAACRTDPSPAQKSGTEASSQASANAAEPVLDRAAMLEIIRNGDPADVLELLNQMVRNRAGWNLGEYEDFYRPLWHLFVRINTPQAGTANLSAVSALQNVFNLGDWRTLLDELAALLQAKDTYLPVKQAAAVHIWRFAGRAKSDPDFELSREERTKMEAVTASLLDDADPELLATALTTAASLGLKSAVPKIKAAVEARTGETTDARSVRFSAAEALFDLGETRSALEIMTALSVTPGDFGDEAAEFLAKNGKK